MIGTTIQCCNLASWSFSKTFNGYDHLRYVKQLHYEVVTPYGLLHRRTGHTMFLARLGMMHPHEEDSHLQTLSSSHIITNTTITLIFGPIYWLFVEESLMLLAIFPLLGISQTRCARCELFSPLLFSSKDL